MALIGKLRQKKGLLVGSMAAALFLFIAMLMFDNPNQSLFGSSRTQMANIDGKKLDYQEFSRLHDILYSNSQSSSDGYNERASLWNFFVDDAILQKEAEAVGLGVSKTELLDLQFSPDQSKLSPIVTSRYANPNTRQVDMEQLGKLKEIITGNKIDEYIKQQQLPPDFRYRWAHQEKEIVKDRLQAKLSGMVAKAIYTPTWQAEMIANDQAQTMGMLYVQVPFDEIENSEVKLTDADYQAYYDENKNQYKQDEETRKVEYVVFPVNPTQADSVAIRQRIADLAEGFRNASSDSVYVESNGGSIDDAYVKKSELAASIADSVAKMPVKDVYGPYLDGDSYKLVKLLGKKVVPDSVKARHILIKGNDLVSTQKTIDSLKSLIEAGTARFDSLAAKFSIDQSNSGKGGDLGFFGLNRMVKPFNDVCFFKAEPGKLYSVATEFGVHLIEVTDRKFGTGESYQVAYVSEPVIPSQATQDAIRDQALQMQEASPNLEALRKAATAANLQTETSPALKANDFSIGSLGTGQASREMIRWAFGVDQNSKPAKVGQVSPQVYDYQEQGQLFNNKFVVAGLKTVLPKGLPALADVKSEIETQVMNRKKGDLIAQRLNGKIDLGSVAATFSSKVDTAASVSFGSAFIGDKGSEPKVVANAFKVPVNQLSKPITGNSGVFVVMPTNIPPPTPSANIAQIKQSSVQSARQLVNMRLITALRKESDIEDERAKFF